MTDGEIAWTVTLIAAYGIGRILMRFREREQVGGVELTIGILTIVAMLFCLFQVWVQACAHMPDAMFHGFRS